MQLKEDEIKIQGDAVDFVNRNKEELINTFILSKNVLPVPMLTIFMAGSPGAGKTEYSVEYEKSTNALFQKIKSKQKIIKISRENNIDLKSYDRFLIRIDVDEIREFIPQYVKTDSKTGIKGNAHIVNKAAAIGLDTLREYCIVNQISFLLDGTFGNHFSTFNKLTSKLLRQDRKIIVFFIYVNPLVAWDFTQKREYVEGRNITKENFIKQYFKSIDNVRRIKEKFKDKVELNCILKDDKNRVNRVFFNESGVEKVLKLGYSGTKITEEYLQRVLI